MNHVSEQILELYLLNGTESAEQRIGIEDHLKVCAQCRDLFTEMQSYYQLLEHGPKQLSPVNESSFGIVVRSEERNEMFVPYSRSLPQRLWRYAKRRPVVASAWSFVLMFFMYTGIEPILAETG
jgi:predicted anti-sigma-YlaC factor YlaD